MKVAIVGRRNTGKSTFVNTLVQAERMIVSEVPGTTRDSVDVRFETRRQGVHRHRHAGLPPPQERRPPTSTSTARTGPSGASAAPTWCCCSSTPRSGSARSTSSSATTSPSSTSRASSWSTSGTCWPTRMPTEKWVDLSARHVPHHVARADRLHHRPDRQERQGAVEPRPDALQAVAEPGEHGRSEHAGPGGAGTQPAAAVYRQPPAEDLLRHPGGHASRRRSCCSATTPRPFPHPYQRYLLGVFRDQLPFGEVPIKLYFRKRESSEAGDEARKTK